MKKLAVILLVVLVFGCEEQPPEEVQVTINVSGFNITTDEFGSLKNLNADIFSDFQHKYSSGLLNFNAPSGAVFTYTAGQNSLNGFTFSITPGTYTLSGNGGSPSYAGRDVMNYTIPGQEVVIYDTTTVLNVNITPNCALVLVADQFDLLASATLSKPITPPEYELYSDGIYYYSYLLPTSDYYIYLTKSDNSKLSIPSTHLEVGYIYKVEVTNNEGTTQINLVPTFLKGEVFVW